MLSFDRRTELLSVLFWLSNYKINYSFIVNMEESSLYSKAIHYFKNTNYKKVVGLFETLVDKYDMTFDAPVALFMQFNEDMTSYFLEEYPYVTRLNKNHLVNELMDEVIMFYKESNFENYYSSNFDYYNNILIKQNSLHLNTIISFMDDLYGKEREQLNLSINITSGTTNGGYCVTNGNQIICSSGLLNNNIYLYDSMVLHEFSHHFINPLTHIWMNDNDKKDDLLFEDIKEIVKKQGYNSNETIINEYMIRAIECCYNDIYSNEDLSSFIEKNMNQGFKDIEHVYTLVKEEVIVPKRLIKDVYPKLLESFIAYLKSKHSIK